MEIFPAIDLKDGKAVRLFQGNYNKMTVYGGDPVEIAQSFKDDGALNLHLVDLDGAKDGMPANFGIIKKIVESAQLFVEVGGGVRDEERISRYIELGVGRVIVGTLAVKNFEFLCEMVRKYGDKIAVSVDVMDGYAAINGWHDPTGVKGMDFCIRLAGAGVETVIYTDISKDGALKGTNLEAYSMLSEIEGLKVIASGGISFESEILQLREKGIHGAILGKALYSGILDLRRVIQLAEGK